MSDDGKRKGRSPSYPAIDLSQAVDRGRALLEKENKHLVPADTALEAWGYSPGSGAGLVVLAALKKYGLIETHGTGANRRVRLSDDAYDILIDEREDSPERCELLRQAALRPRIHAELWDRYGADLPSDSTLRYELRRMGYSDDAARKLIAEWRRTFAYAGLDTGQEQPPSRPDSESAQDAFSAGFALSGSSSRQHAKASQPAGQSVQLPLSPGRWATLSAPFPLVDSEWRQMLDILEAMKPALTEA